jgi:hypothetical protein
MPNLHKDLLANEPSGSPGLLLVDSFFRRILYPHTSNNLFWNMLGNPLWVFFSVHPFSFMGLSHQILWPRSWAVEKVSLGLWGWTERNFFILTSLFDLWNSCLTNYKHLAIFFFLWLVASVDTSLSPVDTVCPPIVAGVVLDSTRWRVVWIFC